MADVDRRLSESLVVNFKAHLPGVVGPATTEPFAKAPVGEIGRGVGVGYVLSGAVRRSDSTVFIQLVRVSDGEHLYALRRKVMGVSLDSVTEAIVTGATRRILGM